MYDIRGKENNKQQHFVMILLLMILVSGLRYRLGIDTIVYMDDFSDYPTLSELKLNDFGDFRYQPLWILINSFSKSLGDFVFVQIITSIIHIGILGYVLKKICPSLIFSSLLFYYLFDFIILNMEVMRESCAISFFLLSALAIDDNRMTKAIIYIAIATLFHVFALPVFIIFWLYYKFLSDRPVVGLFIAICTAIIVMRKSDVLMMTILNLFTGNEDSQYIQRAVNYASNEKYGTGNWSIIGILTNLGKPVFYLFAFFYCRKTCEKYLTIGYKAFSAAIWISVILLFCIYSMPIFIRPYDYFHVFTYLLSILFFVQVAAKFVKRLRPAVYMMLMVVPITFATKYYVHKETVVPNEYLYSRYYPYSSVFEKSTNSHREHIYSYGNLLR